MKLKNAICLSCAMERMQTLLPQMKLLAVVVEFGNYNIIPTPVITFSIGI
jgi:hypothetical protein